MHDERRRRAPHDTPPLVEPKPVPADELRMSVPGCPAVAGLVRDRVGRALRRWGLGHLVDDLALCSTELVTNAVKAAPGREVTVRLVREAAGVLLTVRDLSNAPPVQRPVVEPSLAALDLGGPEDDGGRGLLIVSTLAQRCGYEPHSPRGKTVWARFAR
ncbi:ATP-binding protein [Actinomadura craniellae]|uniref:ATP-binding protein n=1 Tax=Actinomadura craniellae TaxID=2231787 RepID=A0A365H3I9_9ACTN|nr:ATP-binding protein [Actinomadura craniellae]RAY13588.1 ATP-binding protein [Actinomadura craniellae]